MYIYKSPKKIFRVKRSVQDFYNRGYIRQLKRLALLWFLLFLPVFILCGPQKQVDSYQRKQTLAMGGCGRRKNMNFSFFRGNSSAAKRVKYFLKSFISNNKIRLYAFRVMLTV